MTLTEAIAEVTVRIVGNDEGDVHCSICDRRDWYQALELTVAGKENERALVCMRRYDGLSCAEQMAATVDRMEAMSQ